MHMSSGVLWLYQPLFGRINSLVDLYSPTLHGGDNGSKNWNPYWPSSLSLEAARETEKSGFRFRDLKEMTLKHGETW